MGINLYSEKKQLCNCEISLLRFNLPLSLLIELDVTYQSSQLLTVTPCHLLHCNADCHCIVHLLQKFKVSSQISEANKNALEIHPLSGINTDTVLPLTHCHRRKSFHIKYQWMKRHVVESLLILFSSSLLFLEFIPRVSLYEAEHARNSGSQKFSWN